MTLYTGLSSGISVDAQNSNNNKSALAYDNLINILSSNKTLDAVGLKLLVYSVVYGSKDNRYISSETYTSLMAEMPVDLKNCIKKGDFIKTLQAFSLYLNKDDRNYIYSLLNNSSSNFSKQSLSRIQAHRLKSSDIIELTYSADDPALCFQTLKLVRDELIANYKQLIKQQTNDVVMFYEDQIRLVTKQLDDYENDYIKFNQDNNIINYSTQTSNLVSQRLNIDVESDHLKMLLRGNEGVIADLEKKMGIRNRLRLQSATVLSLRDQISKLSTQKALLTSSNSDSIGDSQLNIVLDRKLDKLKTQLGGTLDTMSFYSASPDGISMDAILSLWFNNVVDYEQNKAKLPVLEEREKKIDEMYGQYAPLDPLVKKKEREINVAENKYLSLLSSLNAAKLNDKNADISSSSIRVLDQPFFPFSPMPDKSKILALVAAFSIVILLLSISLIIEYFDKTFSNPIRVERLSGLKVSLLYPVLELLSENSSTRHEVGQMLTIELLRLLDGSFPVQINLLSLYPKEGKTTLMNCLNQELKLISERQQDPRLYNEIRIHEIPALRDNFIDKEKIKSATLNVLVCRATRAWSEIDRNTINNVLLQSDVNTIVLINGVSIDVFEAYMGEILIKRGRVRTFLKKLLALEFKSTDSFNSVIKK